MEFSDHYSINPFLSFEGFPKGNSFREGKRMSKIWRWIFGAALIFMFWIEGTVEAKGSWMGLGVGQVEVETGKTDEGSNHRGCGSVPYRCAEEVKAQEVAKPQRNSREGSKCKKIGRPQSRRQKSGRVQTCQKRRRGSQAKPLDKESILKIITQKVGSGPILEHYIKRMGMVRIIDRMVPSHPNRKISHGETVAAVMIYLLNGERALYRMEKWAEETAILNYTC